MKGIKIIFILIVATPNKGGVNHVLRKLNNPDEPPITYKDMIKELKNENTSI